VEVELKKVGLRLINVNIQDITDESGYIDALGKEAAARAINEAKIKVAQQERDGEIGAAEALRDQRIQVAEANARATEGVNLSSIQIANSNASRREQEAEFTRKAVAAEKVAEAKAKEEAYVAEEQSERQRAKREEATKAADTLVQADIEKEKTRIDAEAQKIETELAAQAEAERIRVIKEAEAKGLLAALTAQADGFRQIVDAAGSGEQAAQLMITEQLPEIVKAQTEAIKNLKIDSVTVWDSGKNAAGESSTAGFLSGLVSSLPPLHEITKKAGLDLPGFLGSPAAGGQVAATVDTPNAPQAAYPHDTTQGSSEVTTGLGHS